MEKKLDKELYPDYVYPEHKGGDEGPPRESILKLGKMITDRIPQKLGIKKITKDDPEYWGLAGVLTDEEAYGHSRKGIRAEAPGNVRKRDSGIQLGKSRP